MFNFLRSGKGKLGDFSLLRTDMHAHWLPGIDDGARDLSASLALVRELHALGFRHLIATPHVMADLYPNTPEVILERLEQVRDAVAAAGLDIRLDASAEYLIDEGLADIIDNDHLLPLPGNRVLVEYSFVAPPRNRDEIYFKLQSRGYHPILAHPERYRYYHKSTEELRALVNRGIDLQVNLGSLAGSYGKEVRRAAEKLIRAGLVRWLGTDVHHIDQLRSLRENLLERTTNLAIANYGWRNAELTQT